MKKFIIPSVAVTLLWVTVSSARAQSPAHSAVPRSRYSPMAAARERGQAPRQADTWYDFLLKQFNPDNLDYGKWLEERRRVFLQATVRNPYFLYSFWMTLWSLLLMTAYTKLWIDRRRERLVTAEMMTDLYNHDLYSREVAREAIRKHNQHIEQCNRVIEAAESGKPLPDAGSGQGDLTAKLQESGAKLEAATRQSERLTAELAQKSQVMADLSLRLEALGTPNGNEGARAKEDEQADAARLRSHINRLQEELYAERQKNRKLKGA